MSTPRHTPSQTVGPFFHPCLLRADARIDAIASAATQGTRIVIEGHVYDGDGAGVPDAVLETWQANHHGRYDHPGDRRPLPLDPTFTGYARLGTDADGGFRLTTIKPGRVPFDATRLQAPHICVAVFARGLLNHLLTRIYFGDDPATPEDPILSRVPAERRGTLLATRADDAGTLAYRFDIVLQGARETVFFDPR